jgi:hypothetical protein
MIFLLLLSMKLLAPSAKSLFIAKIEPLKPYETLWKAICKLESNNDSLAFTIDSNGLPSVGISQVQQIRLDDYNKHTRKNYQLMDCFSPRLSKQIFMYYCVGDYEQIIRKWNGGPGGMKKTSTIVYYQKILLSL